MAKQDPPILTVALICDFQVQPTGRAARRQQVNALIDYCALVVDAGGELVECTLTILSLYGSSSDIARACATLARGMPATIVVYEGGVARLADSEVEDLLDFDAFLARVERDGRSYESAAFRAIFLADGIKYRQERYLRRAAQQRHFRFMNSATGW